MRFHSIGITLDGSHFHRHSHLGLWPGQVNLEERTIQPTTITNQLCSPSVFSDAGLKQEKLINEIDIYLEPWNVDKKERFMGR